MDNVTSMLLRLQRWTELGSIGTTSRLEKKRRLSEVTGLKRFQPSDHQRNEGFGPGFSLERGGNAPLGQFLPAVPS